MTADTTEQLRQEAKRLLAATDAEPQALKRLWQKLRGPEDRALAQSLFARCHKLVLARTDDLEGEGVPDPAAVAELVELLKVFFEFRRARSLLERAQAQKIAQEELALKLGQQHALCTYKDEELPPDSRFRDALAILDSLGLRNPECRVPETLGLGGAIYKRKWEHAGRLEDLRTALHFYRRGWRVSPEKDMGYCGVNAAYILDLLAHQASVEAAREGADLQIAEQYAAEARASREEVQRNLSVFPENWPGQKESYWYKATLAEAFWGLKNWDKAAHWLARAADADHDEWARQTTARQLVSIAAMQGILPPEEDALPAAWHPAWRALEMLLAGDTAAALTCHRGKVGLALSGGGFRASLFHLGVLARLAECDALRCVEVLSTVSGGSIVGAHYYLALRRRLQTMTDGQLGPGVYMEVVREVMRQFCAGISRNLRVRALSSLWANLKMLFTRTYGRSNRMGELYEKFLYDAVQDGHASGEMRRMCDLLVSPQVTEGTEAAAGERDEGFKPKFSNWRRCAKVPILLLNTTSLNSGHNWHFTASWMGEPPGLTGQEVDMNERYRRLYYREAPTDELQNYPLGYAVAASAGVPALFDPLVLKGLYTERTVRLVDGGVHDNQGVAGLLDEGCNLILCSDASGQMDDQKSPASGALSVFLRSDSIFQDRIRETQYQDLAGREQSRALQGLFFIHLKQELGTDPVDWIGCRSPSPTGKREPRTSYGVDRRIQRLLSGVRTDLDTFTEVEAGALMASGYLMTDRQLRDLDVEYGKSGLKGKWAGFNVDAPSGTWPFSALLPVMAVDPGGNDQRARDLARQLEVSRMMFGKVFFLVPWLKFSVILLVAGGLVAGIWWIVRNWERVYTVDFGVGTIVVSIAVLAAGALFPLGRFIKQLDTFRKWLFMVILATAGWGGANLHLLLFDRLYRSRGKLDRLLKLPVE
jgi:tetratricopeptide (TPR) repeat protein